MTLTRNKAIEYMTNTNKIIPKIIIFMVICWIVSPILMIIGTKTNISVFFILGVLLGFFSTILFYGLIFYAIIKFVKIEPKTDGQNIQNNEAPTPKQEFDYNTVINSMPEINSQIAEMQERKRFEKEIFAMEHPILSVFQNRIIPYIWLFAVLCIIIAAVIFFLDYIYGVKLHF